MRTTRILIASLLTSLLFSTSALAAPTQFGGGSEPQSEPHSYTVTRAWETVNFKMGPSIKYWEKVAKCETNTNWKDTGRYAGGLGIMTSGQFLDSDMGTWERYGGEEFAPSPDKATPLEQIIIANRIAVYGYKYSYTKNVGFNGAPMTFDFFQKPVGYLGWGCIKNTVGKPTTKQDFSVRLPKSKANYCPKFEDTFKKYGLPVKVFSYLAWRESRCNPGAVNAKWKDGKIIWTLNSNGTYDSGLLQINSSWFGTLKREMGHTPSDLFNPEINAMFASWILHFTSGRLANWNIRA